jgi:gas vesicle protein
MKHTMEQTQFRVLLLILVGFVAFCLITLAFQIFSVNQLPASFIGACLGAIVSAIITQVLLIAQTSREELNERNVNIFKIKKKMFRKYIKKLEGIWKDQRINSEDFVNICNDFRINLRVFLKKDTANKVAEYLVKLGDCSTEKIPDLELLNSSIFGIINVLSENLGFGGSIDMETDKKIDDKINKYARDFRNAILNELNNTLLNMEQNVLEMGKYERLEDGGEYACFNFKEPKFKGCKLIIGSISQYCAHGGVYMGLYCSKDIHEVDNFRWNDDEESGFPDFSKYWVGIFDIKGRNEWIELTTKLPDKNADEIVGSFELDGDNRWLFVDRPSAIEKFRKDDKYKHVAKIMARRAAWWFEHGEIWEGKKTLSIMSFLTKYLGK